jgi:hypothetical protein
LNRPAASAQRLVDLLRAFSSGFISGCVL